MGHGGPMVDSAPFVRRVAGSNSILAATKAVGTLGKSFTRSCLWRFGVKFQHSSHAVSGVLLSSNGLEKVL